MKIHTEVSANKIINEVFKDYREGKIELSKLKKEIKRRLWNHDTIQNVQHVRTNNRT